MEIQISNFVKKMVMAGAVVFMVVWGIYFYRSKKIQGEKLKKGFGWFVLLMGIYIITKEIFLTSRP